ncbi:hypothetical protein B0H14DRAFT_2621034 [Mycena olivaceomarginata]|nr:hypothetical protein B0H14DRAFT_2621034 [Mycena olivaceomarginata]
MGWYKAVKESLLRPPSATLPSPLSPAPWTGGGVISSTDAAHYEMKDNTIIVVFGASGDLAKKKGYLPTDVQIVGYARTKMDKADFQSRAVSYIKNPDNDAAISAGKNIKEHCYAETGVNRIIVEKPFGSDLDSARELLNALKQYWSEEETYRIDHYLGKEMITFKEPFGTEGREAISTRLVLSAMCCRTVNDQSPDLLQVLSILTMERPVSFSAEDIRMKVKLDVRNTQSRHISNTTSDEEPEGAGREEGKYREKEEK